MSNERDIRHGSVASHQPILTRVCADFEAQLIEMDCEDDYTHLFVEYPPKAAVSSRVNSLKGVSSRLLRKE